MKKIMILLTPILICFIIFSCSKDHEAPNFSKYDIASKPTNVDATYDSTSDAVNVTWDMVDTASVIDYIVSVSDSSDFDMGNVVDYPVRSMDKIYTLKMSNYVSSDIKSITLYLTVSAVYKNADLHYFIGPRADTPAVVLVERE